MREKVVDNFGWSLSNRVPTHPSCNIGKCILHVWRFRKSHKGYDDLWLQWNKRFLQTSQERACIQMFSHPTPGNISWRSLVTLFIRRATKHNVRAAVSKLLFLPLLSAESVTGKLLATQFDFTSTVMVTVNAAVGVMVQWLCLSN